MKRLPIRLGPLSLLLTVISICLTVLAILTFTTARADLRLAEKYARTVQTRYALEREGQAFLAEADAAAAEGALELTEDGFRLQIGLRRDGAGVETAVWKHERLWEEDDSLNLWPGF